MVGKDRALLVYDGSCAFCRLWADHWRGLTDDRVQYATSQEIAASFPDVPREKYARAVQLIDDDGARYEGAAAVFRLYAKRSGFGWIWGLYEAPAVAPISEWCYRLVARNRPFFLRLTHLFWGEKVETPKYGLTARIFLQALSVVYFFAFLSLLPQLPGLVGAQGLLPAESYLTTLRAEHGVAATWLAPTLAWFGAHDGALQFMALVGIVLSFLAFGGILLAPCLLLMWALYLSLVVAGQSFTAFPWDLLLLEAGFLAIFLVPFRRAVGYRSRVEASSTVVWLFRFLLFRLLFGSGLMKLLSGDAAWRNLTALGSHFETQPLPTAPAWFVHQMPSALLKAATLAALACELVVPFLFFLPRRARQLGALITAGYQLLLLLTGNFAFLNWLTLALCLLLLDDKILLSFRPKRSKAEESFRNETDPSAKAGAGMTRKGKFRTRITTILAIALVTLGLTRLVAPFVRLPMPVLLFTAILSPLRISNDYGLFAVMATSRPEVVIEGSEDGATWKEYTFAAKPGDAGRMPGWVAPFQPRLDWQLWLAARSEPGAQPWIAHLMIRLLQGSKPALALFESDPFSVSPPQFVRATLYAYRFTTPEERSRDGAWWRREMKASYLPTLSLGAQPGGAP